MADDVDLSLIPNQPGDVHRKATDTVVRLCLRTTVPIQIRGDISPDAAVFEHSLHANPHTCSGPKTMQKENGRSTAPTRFVPEHRKSPDPTAIANIMRLFSR